MRKNGNLKKFKIYLLLNYLILMIIINLFMYKMSNKYLYLDTIVRPTIFLKINKIKNMQGLYLNPTLLFNNGLKSIDQTDYIMIYVIASFILFLLIFNEKKKNISHGSASFATLEEIDEMGITGIDDGVILGMDKKGRILSHNGVEHISAMAPTRSGKGINTVLPTLWTWKSSIIVNDIKGECWELTAGFRRSVFKQKCVFFNPMDETGEGICYNPLALVMVGTGSEQEDARTIATTLIDTEGKGSSDHWISSAINLLTSIILHVKYLNVNASFLDILQFMEDPKEPLVQKIGAVIGKKVDDYGDIVNDPKKPPINHYMTLKKQGGINNKDFNYLYKEDTTLHPIVGKTFATIFATPDKERGSIFSTCVNKLGIFKDSRIIKNVGKSDLVPKDLMNERISLYLITPPKAIDMTRPLFRLIITQTIYELTDKMEFGNRKKVDKELKKINYEKQKKALIHKINNIKNKFKNFFYKKEEVDYSKHKNKRLLFLIDEFPALGNLSLLEQALAYIAGYGLKVLLISQSINQLRKIYGKDNSILDNTHVQIYFTPNDSETPKMISDILGNATEKQISKSGKGMFLTQRNESYHGRALMTPAEVRSLPFLEILVFITGKNPIHGKKIQYWTMERFKHNQDYSIPYRSFVEFVKKLEEHHLNEYVAEYLIYLTGSYPKLKEIIDSFSSNVDNFIERIIFDKNINILIEKEYEEFLALSSEKKIELKKLIILERLENLDKNEYEKKEKIYMTDFVDEQFKIYIKIKIYEKLLLKKEKLEDILERNLKKILDKKRRLKFHNKFFKLNIIKLQKIKKIYKRKNHNENIFESFEK